MQGASQFAGAIKLYCGVVILISTQVLDLSPQKSETYPMFKHLPFPLRLLFAAVAINYLAQIPYSLHLYGFNENPRGAVLLGFTRVWFHVAFGLLALRKVDPFVRFSRKFRANG